MEVGETDPQDATRRRYDNYEMASRLSYFFWNSTPDDALLDAAERGELTGAQGLRTQAARLAQAPRAREALTAFFVELLGLDGLDTLSKDATLFPRMTPTLATAMREETIRAIDEVTFERDADLREIFDSRTTFVNTELAALYGLPAPTAAGFSRVELPTGIPRRGILGHASFLALHSHAERSSPTLRGKFIRETLMCQGLPEAPPVIPELPGTEGLTLRQRLEQHRTDMYCASCHRLMDPMGLGLENFDAIGAYRATDQGQPIDPSGDVDGVAFNDAASLGTLLRNHEDTASCLALTLYRYATGHLETRGERRSTDSVLTAFTAAGHRFRALAVEIATSDGFRYASEPAN